MCIEGCVKFVVFAFNFVFLLVGSALIAVGAFYKVKFTEVTDAIPEDYSNLQFIPILTIVIGCVVFLISFFGCCGACKESSCLLTTYAAILLTIFVLQIALGVYVFLEMNDPKDLQDKIENAVEKVFVESKTNNKTGVVSFIQQQFKCCGTTGPTFWEGNIPASCYDGKNPGNGQPYSAGCNGKFYDFIKNSANVIGITILVLSATEVIGAVLTLCLANSIRNENRRGRYN